MADIHFRDELLPTDLPEIRAIVESTGFFYPAEVDVAVELAHERLTKGAPSGYHFIFAEHGGRVVGYTCYGEIACTVGSYDVFWIAVYNDFRGHGLGKTLLTRTEQAIAQRGGRRIYLETSGREKYQPTRAFYDRCGYHAEATLKDFYALGDDKVVYVKAVGETKIQS